MHHNLQKYPRKSKVKTTTITDWKKMAICLKLYFSQFSEKWKDRIFLFLLFIVFFDGFVFRYRHRKKDNLEMTNQLMRQKNFIMLPDDVLSKICNEAMFKVTASTCRKIGGSKTLVANEFCDHWKSGALRNHFISYFQNMIFASQ